MALWLQSASVAFWSLSVGAADAVIGTFDGLAERATISQSGNSVADQLRRRDWQLYRADTNRMIIPAGYFSCPLAFAR